MNYPRFNSKLPYKNKSDIDKSKERNGSVDRHYPRKPAFSTEATNEKIRDNRSHLLVTEPAKIHLTNERKIYAEADQNLDFKPHKSEPESRHQNVDRYRNFEDLITCVSDDDEEEQDEKPNGRVNNAQNITYDDQSMEDDGEEENDEEELEEGHVDEDGESQEEDDEEEDDEEEIRENEEEREEEEDDRSEQEQEESEANSGAESDNRHDMSGVEELAGTSSGDDCPQNCNAVDGNRMEENRSPHSTSKSENESGNEANEEKPKRAEEDATRRPKLEANEPTSTTPVNIKLEPKKEPKNEPKTEPATKPLLSVRPTKDLIKDDKLAFSSIESQEKKHIKREIKSEKRDESSAPMLNNIAIGCDVCCTPFGDEASLEQHRITNGHFKCRLDANCATIIFPTRKELETHHATSHNIPIPPSHVQYLESQVNGLVGGPYMPVPSIPFAPQKLPVRPHNKGHPPMPMQPGMPPNRMPMKRSQARLPNAPPNMIPMKRTKLPNDQLLKNQMRPKLPAPMDLLSQLSKTISLSARSADRSPQPKSGATSAVANMLANRGITVSSVSPSHQNGITMNLNSSVSITQTHGSADKNRMTTTVDLTGPDISSRRGRPSSRYPCNKCNQVFATSHLLDGHNITVHKSRKSMPYKCNQCTAQYPNAQGLQQHKLIFHRSSSTATRSPYPAEMGIPVVDLTNTAAVARLRSLGITEMIPLSFMTQSSSGAFGLPIVRLGDRTINSSTLGANNVLQLGPLTPLR